MVARQNEVINTRISGGMKGDVRIWFVSILINNDSGFPHSTDVDNPEWIRNSSPPEKDSAEAS